MRDRLDFRASPALCPTWRAQSITEHEGKVERRCCRGQGMQDLLHAIVFEVQGTVLKLVREGTFQTSKQCGASDRWRPRRLLLRAIPDLSDRWRSRHTQIPRTPQQHQQAKGDLEKGLAGFAIRTLWALRSANFTSTSLTGHLWWGRTADEKFGEPTRDPKGCCIERPSHLSPQHLTAHTNLHLSPPTHQPHHLSSTT